ncbi:TetR/AcrR family transcriptional regulator [Ferrovibrio sp.]|uniref:TetR/AcrR family transcriptional regulator n=1 Tax=Ferrovibrio sp. TaxID=1917215 RepID=UPI00262124C5|nr:TetR/AcrR family transcriptional regulator [Ferrovibrio sp.]
MLGKPTRKPAARNQVASDGNANGPAGAIRRRNVEKILKAAESVFAKKGFAGASTAEIARKAGVPKANLHYYFRTKQELYASVLDAILEVWLDALDQEIQPEADPATALSNYIARKMAASQRSPEPSRLWAIEVIGGGRHVQPFLRNRLRRLVKEKTTVIEGWIAAGKLKPVNPTHLLFMIWAMTQTYADFAAQIAAVLDKKSLDDAVFATGSETIRSLILNGLGARQKIRL